MATYIALLRAVNVGGTGKLSMDVLRDVCRACGFGDVQTYIASGNVVFKADGDEAQVQTALSAALHAHLGAPVGLMLRSAQELAAVLAANPYGAQPPNLVHVIFLDGPASPQLLDGVTGQAGEAIAFGLREIYVHYPQGQGASKLKISAAKAGTARNVNTVAKLAALAGG
jgi:uncharacterized protein (DUF1697 family)